MVELESWKNYREFAVENNLDYTSAVAAKSISGWSKIYTSPFSLLQIQKPTKLSKFAQILDRSSQKRWMAIESSLLKKEYSNQPKDFPFFDDLILSNLIDNPDIGKVCSSFSTGAQMAYVENRFGVSLDDPDIELFGDRRIGKAAGLAALEIIYQKELNKEGYDFSYLSTFLSIQQIDGLLDIRLPENHPINFQRKKITRRQLIGAYAPSLITVGVVGAITGGSGLIVKDALEKFNAQDKDPNSIDFKGQIAVINNNMSHTNNNLSNTFDIQTRRQLQTELDQLKYEKERINREWQIYKSQNYGGKWWKLLFGIPITGFGALTLVAGIFNTPVDVKEELEKIKIHNLQAESE